MSGVPKNETNDQFARTANDAGLSNSPATGADQGTEPLADIYGRLIVIPATGSPSGNIVDPTTLRKITAGYGKALATPIDYFLYQLSGFNINAATRWIQLFSGIVAPAPGTVPLLSIIVPTNTNFSYAPALPLSFPTGLFVTVSTTGPTYTASGTDDIWLNIEGKP